MYDPSQSFVSCREVGYEVRCKLPIQPVNAYEFFRKLKHYVFLKIFRSKRTLDRMQSSILNATELL
jgi:catabolite regulation protein CreA